MGHVYELKGACHCGNIRYTVETSRPPQELPHRKCCCSFCTRHGAVYTSDPDARMRYKVVEYLAVNRYRFGHGTADYFICRNCGMVPFILSTIKDREYAVINLNTVVDPIIPAPEHVPVANYEGEDPAIRLARRQQTWIADVEVES